jgi:hypothetical protein
MLLVPKQLQRVGMTGDVPYYGGRLTPDQAYAASHPRRAAPPPPSTTDPEATVEALDQLRANGVITDEEYDDLRARLEP